MLTLRSRLIALSILCFLFMFGMVKSSLAIEIVDFPSNTEDTSYNGYTYHMAYVKTDVPIYHVNWYIDDVIAYSETLDSTTKNASYFPCYDPTSSAKMPCNVQGKNYKISVKVWGWDADDEVFRSTTASYTVRMFQPKYVSGIKNDKPTVTGVYGYVKLSRHYHDGSNIVVNGSVYASNGTENACSAKAWFRQTDFGGGTFNVQDPAFGLPNPSTPLPSGGSYYKSGSSAVSYPVDGPIGDEQIIILNAHIHLQVAGNGTTDVWHDNDWTHTFTYKDNKDYIGE